MCCTASTPGCYEYEHGNHYVTDGRHKYVWYTQTDREHLFNLDEDPLELKDLATGDGSENRLTPMAEAIDRVSPGPT